jgi:hypothetical protein
MELTFLLAMMAGCALFIAFIVGIALGLHK